MRKPDILVPSSQEDVALTATALADPDAQPLSDEFMRKPFRKGLGGRPKADITKKPVSLRLDEEVINYFKSKGAGWQTRMNDILADYVRSHRL